MRRLQLVGAERRMLRMQAVNILIVISLSAWRVATIDVDVGGETSPLIFVLITRHVSAKMPFVEYGGAAGKIARA